METDAKSDPYQLPLADPVFVQNPDGSLAIARPPGCRERTPPTTPRQRLLEPVMANAMVSADIVRVLARHETLFLSLLFIQLMVETSFEVMHIRYRDDAIFELALIYPSLEKSMISVMYWLAFIGESVFCFSYFCLGVLAACKSKPRLYQRFSMVALIGTLGQLPLAYLNRFNLLVFFLRFIAYAYSRFQWNLLQGIVLISGGEMRV
eukprot:gnl/TRDRNA2_/TRDRNA2_179531_c0_seq1.p1 gnl/TRDRNA2_/TRDRNA2_179531_c0~~gnl/TRDRNA2_/TRDRNA2_179531_c0_seq1.p1  ORF type:complete len:207 (+),score=31.49 gnl/TRDRNA2_/TRDRNA2_179531_c0_seq1:127-747(+)